MPGFPSRFGPDDQWLVDRPSRSVRIACPLPGRSSPDTTTSRLVRRSPRTDYSPTSSSSRRWTTWPPPPISTGCSSRPARPRPGMRTPRGSTSPPGESTHLPARPAAHRCRRTAGGSRPPAGIPLYRRGRSMVWRGDMIATAVDAKRCDGGRPSAGVVVRSDRTAVGRGDVEAGQFIPRGAPSDTWAFTLRKAPGPSGRPTTTLGGNQVTVSARRRIGARPGTIGGPVSRCRVRHRATLDGRRRRPRPEAIQPGALDLLGDGTRRQSPFSMTSRPNPTRPSSRTLNRTPSGCVSPRATPSRRTTIPIDGWSCP